MLISFNWCHFSVALSVYVPQGFIILADYVYKAIDALPVTAHPMTQFASGIIDVICKNDKTLRYINRQSNRKMTPVK